MADGTKFRFPRKDQSQSADPDQPSDDTSFRSAGRQPNNDPLAELARLIGQEDPYARSGRSSAQRSSYAQTTPSMYPTAQPAWLRPESRAADRQWTRSGYAVPSRDHRYASDAGYAQEHDDSSRDAGYAHQAYSQNDYSQRTADAQHYDDTAHQHGYAAHAAHDDPNPPAADGYYAADDAGQDHDPNDPYYAEDGQPLHGEPDYEAVAPRRRSGMMTIGAVLGLALVGSVGAYAYRSISGPPGTPAQAPVIKADVSPTKVVPAVQSGEPQTSKMYDRVASISGQGERVVPREEPPVDAKAAAAQAVAPAAPLVSSPPSPGRAGSPVTSGLAGGPSDAKRVRTVVIRPEVAGAAGAPMPDPTAQDPVALALQGQDAPVPTPKARNQKNAALPPPKAAAGYVVQITAQKTEAEAQASYKALQAKYKDVLASRKATIRRADLGDKGVYYRAQIGPFDTSDQANEFCRSLKAAGGQCAVMKN